VPTGGSGRRCRAAGSHSCDESLWCECTGQRLTWQPYHSPVLIFIPERRQIRVMKAKESKPKFIQRAFCALIVCLGSVVWAQPDRVARIRLMGCNAGAQRYAAEAHKIGQMLTLASTMNEELRQRTLKQIAEYADQLRDTQYQEHMRLTYRDFDAVDTLLLHQAQRMALILAIQRGYKAPTDPEIRHQRNIESECVHSTTR
jgi:hypothetical protein